MENTNEMTLIFDSRPVNEGLARVAAASFLDTAESHAGRGCRCENCCIRSGDELHYTWI